MEAQRFMASRWGVGLDVTWVLEPNGLAAVMLFNGLYCTGNSTGVFSRDALYEDGEVYAFGTDFRHLGVRKYAAANPDGGWNAANAVYEIFKPFAREDQKRHVTSNVEPKRATRCG